MVPLQLNTFNRVSFTQIIFNSTKLACNMPPQEAPEMRGSLFVSLAGDIVRCISLNNMRYAFDNAKRGDRLTTSLKHNLNTIWRIGNSSVLSKSQLSRLLESS